MTGRLILVIGRQCVADLTYGPYFDWAGGPANFNQVPIQSGCTDDAPSPGRRDHDCFPIRSHVSSVRFEGWNAIITASARSGDGVPSGALSTTTLPAAFRE
jgi:hypothetical protein